MKNGIKLSILFVAAALMIMGVAGTGYAFHEGGVAYCEGCHTMHESINNAVVQIQNGTKTNMITPVGTSQFQNASQYLLKGSDASSTCFNCHRVADAAPSSYHIMSTAAAGANFNANTGIPTERTPGGDFAWLTINGSPGTGTAGKHKGHNVVSADFGLTSSTNYAAGSPGGNYPTAGLSCVSCHDPHPAGRQKGGVVSYRSLGSNGEPIEGSGSYNNSSTTETVGVYRFLGGVGYKNAASGASAAFVADPPFAVVNSSYNRTESATDTRVAYGSGMSEWCANCHASILNNAALTGATHIHPAGSNALMSQGEGAIYDAYVKTGDMSGDGSAAYTSLVPFEMGLSRNLANYMTLQSYAVTDGSKAGGVADAVVAGGTPNVMCLSCHRAHASAFPFALRFGATGGEFVTGADNAYAGYDSTDSEGSNSRINYGYNQAQMQAAYYDRPGTKFAATQRVLCNKCHAKD
jgi:hypothetical protein